MSWFQVTVLVACSALFQCTFSENTCLRRPTAPVSTLQLKLPTCFCPRPSPLIIPYPYLQINGRKSRINYARSKPTAMPKITEGQMTGYIFRIPICITRPVETKMFIELPLSIFSQPTKESSKCDDGNTLDNPLICTDIDTNKCSDNDQDILQDGNKNEICSEEFPKSNDASPTLSKEIIADKEDAPQSSKNNGISTTTNDDKEYPVDDLGKDNTMHVNYELDNDSKKDKAEFTKENSYPVESQSPTNPTPENTSSTTGTDDKTPKKDGKTEVPCENLDEDKAYPINKMEASVEYVSPKDAMPIECSSAKESLCNDDKTYISSLPDPSTDKETVNDHDTISGKCDDEIRNDASPTLSKEIIADKEDAPQSSKNNGISTTTNEDKEYPVDDLGKDNTMHVNYELDNDSKKDKAEFTKENSYPVESQSPTNPTPENTSSTTGTDDKTPKKDGKTEVPCEDLDEDKAYPINKMEASVECVSPKDAMPIECSPAKESLCNDDKTYFSSLPDPSTDKETVNDHDTISGKCDDEIKKSATSDDIKPYTSVMVESDAPLEKTCNKDDTKPSET